MKKIIKSSIITTLVAGNVAIVSLAPGLTFAKEKGGELIRNRPAIVTEAGKFIKLESLKERFNQKEFKAYKAFTHLSKYLGISNQELITQWKELGSIAAVIENNNKSVDEVKQYLINESEEKIDKALSKGKISEERAELLREKRDEKLEFLLYQAKAPEL